MKPSFLSNWEKQQLFIVPTLTLSSYSNSGTQRNRRTGDEVFPVLEIQQPLCWPGNSRVPPLPYSDFLSSIIVLSIHNLGFLLKEKVLSSANSFSRLISTWTVSTWTLVPAYGSRRHRSKTRRQRWERMDLLEAYIISASFWSCDVKVRTPRQCGSGIIS